MSSIQSSTIEFSVNGEKRSFTVLHNLGEYNLEIFSAAVNWAARIENYEDITVENFCKYVVSKDPLNLICKPFI